MVIPGDLSSAFCKVFKVDDRSDGRPASEHFGNFGKKLLRGDKNWSSNLKKKLLFGLVYYMLKIIYLETLPKNLTVSLKLASQVVILK